MADVEALQSPSPVRSGTPAKAKAEAGPLEPVRALTAVRGLAAWWVVAYHFRDALPKSTPAAVMDGLARGYLAVDLFFVLSGFVIALNYAAWFERGGWRAGMYLRFLALRLSRLYPLHIVILLLFLLNPAAIALFSHQGDLNGLRPGYYVLSILLMQAWGFTGNTAWNVPAWSISVEWLAYLVFPLLAVAVFRATGSAARSAAFIGGVLAAFGTATVALDLSGIGYDGQWFGVMRCLFEFSAGIGLCRLVQGRRRTQAEGAVACLAALVCFAAYAVVARLDYVFMPLGFVALIYGVSDERGSLARALRWPPLQWLGLVSYSTYLAHYLIKTWVKFLLVRPSVPAALPFVAYVLAVALASALLHRFVERPGQRALRTALAAGRQG